MARYASLLNAGDASVDAWVGAVRIGWGTIPLYRDLQQQIGVLAGKSRSEDLLAMFRTMLRFEPENPDLLNNFYYLGLLHGLLAPADSRAGLEPLIARFPERTEFKSALAMAYLQLGDQPQAEMAAQRARLLGNNGIMPWDGHALHSSLLAEMEAALTEPPSPPPSVQANP